MQAEHVGADVAVGSVIAADLGLAAAGFAPFLVIFRGESIDVYPISF
jgi:hypothetical protein